MYCFAPIVSGIFTLIVCKSFLIIHRYVSSRCGSYILIIHNPNSKVHGSTCAHLGSTGSRWAPCCPHELCYRGSDFYFNICVFVCFITKSFLTYSFVSTSPALSTICRPLSSYVCSITPETAKVGSSYSHTGGPDVGCWFPDRSNCSHWSFEAAVLPINPNIYTDQWEHIVIYHYYFYWSLYNYAAHAADVLTATTVVQGVDNHSWGLYCRRCYCICVCWSFQWDIAISTMIWPAKHNPNQGRQSTHR